MDSQTGTQIIILGILLVMSGFFSATETAFSSINRIRMKHLANNGNKKASHTLELSEDFDKVLSTILIGNNIVNIASAAIATVLFTRHYGNAGITISTAVTTILVLIFGEITPKSLAKESPEAFAMFSTPILRILTFLLQPINYIFSLWKKLLSKVFKFKDKQTITQEELITLVEEAESEGGLDSHEGELIRSAIEFNDLDVEEILTPRVKVVAVSETASLDEIKRTFMKNGFSRLPVYKKTVDNIIGVIHEKDFYNVLYDEKNDIQSITKSIVCVAPQTKISKLLRLLQHSKSHISVVVDEYGGTMGIVTLEDILEELVGEIWDEHDEVIEFFSEIENNKYLVHCNANLEELFTRFELKSKSYDYDAVTVGGWIVHQFGRIPDVGNKFVFEHLQVTVTKTDNKRVLEITVEVLE
ncbi:MAG: HlyC/CorC family transporter [Firmicutes bacterium HGW-Firmicutes-5]|nr:MAG: HlyC/CorC family transporter [Firmicutes bacterium HGW-Firmicutes-5]